MRLRLLPVLALLVFCLPALAQQPEIAPEVAAAPKPKGPLNFNFDGTPATEAFKQLGEAAGVNIKADAQVLFDADPIFLKVENGYFWPALLDMAKQAKLIVPTFARNVGAREVELVQANRGFPSIEKLPRSDADGHVIVLQHAFYSRNIGFQEKSQRSANFNLAGVLFVDPGRSIVQILPSVVTEAVDEKGNSYVPQAGNQPGIMPGQTSTLTQNVYISLSGEPKGEKLVNLKGTLRMRVITEEKVITVDDLSTLPLTVTAGTQQIRLEASEGTMFGITATITGSSDTQQEAWAKMSLIRLTDADGRPLRYAGGSSSGGRFPNGSDQPIVARANFSGAGTGAGPARRLSWHYPMRTEIVESPFSFSNLPLP